MDGTRSLAARIAVRAYRAAAAGAIVAGALLARAPAAPYASAQTGTLHTLTEADNGTTQLVQVGDSVELRLQADATWTVDPPDPAILRRPPIALVRGVQGFWNVIGAGQTTISATGKPPCQGTVCIQLALVFNATIIASGNPPPPTGQSATYQPGWNIAGVPSGTVMPVDAFIWDPAAFRYLRVAAGTPLRAGRGYWVNFAATQTVPLAATTRTREDVQAPAGQWILVGNPSGLAAATVVGADLIYVYNPATGAYVATAAIGPGAGAWVLSFNGSVVAISAPPLPPPAQPDR